MKFVEFATYTNKEQGRSTMADPSAFSLQVLLMVSLDIMLTVQLGSVPINLIKMAPEMAKICKEGSEKRTGDPVELADNAD